LLVTFLKLLLRTLWESSVALRNVAAALEATVDERPTVVDRPAVVRGTSPPTERTTATVMVAAIVRVARMTSARRCTLLMGRE
jgi:hypothetical protein